MPPASSSSSPAAAAAASASSHLASSSSSSSSHPSRSARSTSSIKLSSVPSANPSTDSSPSPPRYPARHPSRPSSDLADQSLPRRPGHADSSAHVHSPDPQPTIRPSRPHVKDKDKKQKKKVAFRIDNHHHHHQDPDSDSDSDGPGFTMAPADEDQATLLSPGHFESPLLKQKPSHDDRAPPHDGRGRYKQERSSRDSYDDDDADARDNLLNTDPLHGHAGGARRPAMMRSQSPDTQAKEAGRKKYIYAGIFLLISLVSFSVQTELGAYVQHELGWNKSYCMLYLTHGSWVILWPAQLLILRLQKWKTPWPVFWRRHVQGLRSTAHMVFTQDLEMPHSGSPSPVPYLLRTTAFVTSCLTVAGLGWYVAVNMTSPSDLTAIYNCSAFFAYAFSVPLLREKLRIDKSIAVLVAIAGVLIVAYGDSKEPGHGGGAKDPGTGTGTRLLGNLIIGASSVLYGLYEVLYKRWACPPEGVDPSRGMIFANAFGSCIGAFTLLVLWVPLPILHFLGWELFELPTGMTAVWLFVSVIMNATFAGSFLVLISLTSPVLSSVAALLTIFIVAILDWLLKGESLSLSAIVGGCLIIAAFLVLSWSTWREITEEESHKASLEAGIHTGAANVDWSSEDEEANDDDDDERRRSVNDKVGP